MKKLFISLLLMLVCIPVYAANDVTFYYDSKRVEEMWITRVGSSETRSAHPYLLKRRGDNTYVYCLESFKLMQNDSKYTYDNDYTKYGLTKSDIDRINLIIYYGYGYGNHTSDKWYGVTQYLIWKITDKDADIYFSNERYGSKANLYVDELNEIESLIKEHNTEPNFIKDYIISTNSNLVIDSNINLSNYDIVSNAKYDIKNNKLYFNNLDVGNYKVKLVKKNNRFNSDYMLYYSNESQNVIIPGNSNVTSKEYSFNISVEEGTIELTKKNKDNEYLSGAKYGIYNGNELVTELTTDEKGYASTKLAFGKYVLKELSAPLGYEVDSKEYEFEFNKDNKKVNFELTDSKIYIEILFNKKDKESNEYLSGAKYGIFNGEDLISEITTDEKGYASTKLSFGKYKLKEIEAPIGYELDTNEYDIIVDENTKELNINLEDSKIYVDVKLSKKSTYDNKYLKNAVYGVYSNDKLIDKITTTDGISVVSLPFGKYKLKELVAPPGYKLDTKEYEFTIDENNLDVSLNLFDDKIVVKVPNTGLTGSNLSYYLVIIGIIGIVYGKKNCHMY